MSVDSLLLFGASGLVGEAVLRLAGPRRIAVQAVSRTLQPASGGRVVWHAGRAFDLHQGEGPWPEADRVISAGPLDALATWLERTRPPALRRLAALSSTSVVTKTQSSDPRERALVERLAQAESRVIDYCAHAGVGWTLLRPTLIWGAGRDRNLSRLAAMARRYGFIALPSFARGLRQPIRADDVAAALLAAVERPQAMDRLLDLPGGETLSYDEMSRRIAAAVAPPGRIIRLPGAFVLGMSRAAGWLGAPAGMAAILARTRDDLAFDGAPAQETLGWVPGGFDPVSADFPGT